MVVNPIIIILAAMVLMVVEIFVPSFGILGIGGLVGFIVGLFLLLNELDPTQRATVLSMIVPSFIVLLAIFGAIAYHLIKSRSILLKKGEETLLGQIGVAAEDFSDRDGLIRIDGELWSAEHIDDSSVKRGDKLIVLARSGLKLTVQIVRA